ncbi:MAG: hypothetical protein WC471_02900 [Candidatus Woesearchaeota archaeon]
MERLVSDVNILNKFCTDFCNIVEKHCKYIIVSGFVAIASGRARGTEDIDMILERIDQKKFEKLHNDLAKHDFICMQSEDVSVLYNDYLKDSTSIRYTRSNQPLPEMEVKLSKDMLDDYQISTRQKIPLIGLDVWFSSINFNIAFKEELLKSDKDMQDARHLRVVFKEDIDENEIFKIKKMIREYRLK